MKCPKCGYLGFETSDRCRNCGYDFSLAADVRPSAELPLHSQEGAGVPLADLDLGSFDPTPPPENMAAFDLDRLIGEEPGEPAAAESAQPARRGPPARSVTPAALPLFNESDADDTPLITTPRPVRPPLSVRRTTPEIPRTRAKTATPRLGEGELDFPSEPVDDVARIAPPIVDAATDFPLELAPASSIRRILATFIDVVLLAAIDLVVIYLTLALVGLTMDEISVLPALPLVTFFVLLDGGYLVVFIAASGQTIGKLVTGIRVLREDGRRVTVAGAVVRAAGCAASLLTAGIGYLPAFITVDRRALQDRVAGTRVVSAR
jgi:uncharacterized RDD family membrane protein YckC